MYRGLAAESQERLAVGEGTAVKGKKGVASQPTTLTVLAILGALYASSAVLLAPA
jgi:hypothetical protein